jgi:hypothetical protein
MRPTTPRRLAQAFLPLLTLLLLPTARSQLHAGRHAMITPAPAAAAGLPVVGGLVPRSAAAPPACAASQTACDDGNGCCPSGADCISSAGVGLCALACAAGQPTCLFGGVTACCPAAETCGAALCVPPPPTTEAGMAPPPGTPLGTPMSLVHVTKTEVVPVGACAMTETFCSWAGESFSRGCCASGYQCVTASAGMCTSSWTSGVENSTCTTSALGLTGAALLSTTTVTLQVATGGASALHRQAVGWGVLGAVGVVIGL